MADPANAIILTRIDDLNVPFFGSLNYKEEALTETDKKKHKATQPQLNACKNPHVPSEISQDTRIASLSWAWGT